MKRLSVYIILIHSLFINCLYSQSKFSKLSSPEKRWVLFHPFVAKKAFNVTKKVMTDVDSIKRLGIIGTDINGGKLDAFKHSYWMASLSLKIGSRRALKLGIAHENGNYLQWKKKLLEDSILPDSVSSEMDLKNNIAGVYVYEASKHMHFRSEMIDALLAALNEGKLFVIKKDEAGNYLTCEGALLNIDQWKGKWDIPKCLVPSNTN